MLIDANGEERKGIEVLHWRMTGEVTAEDTQMIARIKARGLPQQTASTQTILNLMLAGF